MRHAPARGFTYLGLLILLAVMGLTAAAALKVDALLQRAAAEEELLEIGAQFSDALRSYAAATPQGQPQQPRSLQELLKDPRFPNPRRHLRKIFVDPMTGKAEWGIVWLGDKVGVLGVHSLSDKKPFKVANFDLRFQNMENRERISDWKFIMTGGDALRPGEGVPPNSPVAPGGSLFNNPPPGAAPLEPPKDAAPPPAPPAPEPEPEPEPEAEPEEAAKPEEGTPPEGQGNEEGQAQQGAADSSGQATPQSVSPPPAQRR